MSATNIIGLFLGLAAVVELKRIAGTLTTLARHAQREDELLAAELARADRLAAKR